MSSFSAAVWQANLPLFERTLALPFNQELAQAYRYSAELEWMFWDSAWHLGAWPTR